MTAFDQEFDQFCRAQDAAWAKQDAAWAKQDRTLLAQNPHWHPDWVDDPRPTGLISLFFNWLHRKGWWWR